MDFADLVRGFGQKIGVDLSVDEDGLCALNIDDMRVSIQNIDEVGLVSVFGEIGDPPPQGLEELLLAMLSANHLFQGTSGATISRDPETQKFYLCRCDVSSVLDLETFSSNLEKFVNTLETWRKLVADYRPVAGEKEGREGPEMAEAPGLGGFMQV